MSSKFFLKPSRFFIDAYEMWGEAVTSSIIEFKVAFCNESFRNIIFSRYNKRCNLFGHTLSEFEKQAMVEYITKYGYGDVIYRPSILEKINVCDTLISDYIDIRKSIKFGNNGSASLDYFCELVAYAYSKGQNPVRVRISSSVGTSFRKGFSENYKQILDFTKALGIPEGSFWDSIYFGDEYEMPSLDMVKIYRFKTEDTEVEKLAANAIKVEREDKFN